MQKTTITEKEIICSTLVFMNSVALLLSIGPTAKNDSWISIIFATILTIPLIFIINLMFSMYPNDNFFLATEKILGKILGKVLLCVLMLSAIFFINISLLTILDFIQIARLFYTPIIVILIVILVTVYFTLHKSPKIMVNWGETIFYYTCIFLFISSIFIFKNVHPEKVLPIAHNNWKNIYIGTIEVLSFLFCKIIFVTSLVENMEHKNHIGKVMVKIVVISMFVVVMISFQNIAILGNSRSKYYFPNYELYRRLGKGSLFQRMEILLSTIFGIAEIFKCSFFVYFSVKTLHHLLNTRKYQTLLIPTLFLVGNNLITDFQSILLGVDENKFLLRALNVIFIYFFILCIFVGIIFRKLRSR